jgi:hypothetical protein
VFILSGEINMPSKSFPSKYAVLLFAGVGLFLASLACSSIPFLAPSPTPTATTTPTPTETSTPTITPTVTPTFTPSLTPTQSYLDWPVVLSDSFGDNSNGWYVGTVNNEYLRDVVSITGGRYVVDATAYKSVFSRLFARTRVLSDFYLIVEAEKTGTINSDFGLVFRDNSTDQYYFAISSDEQSYSLDLYDAGEWKNLIDWRSTSQIKTAGPNQIAVLALGSSFTLFINGETVDQFSDSTLKAGKVGFGFSLAKAGDKAVFGFDNFEVRAPKKNA